MNSSYPKYELLTEEERHEIARYRPHLRRIEEIEEEFRPAECIDFDVLKDLEEMRAQP